MTFSIRRGGENFFFQPHKIPADAKYIQFGHNIVVASNVNFICHDVIHYMLNNSRSTNELQNSEGEYSTYWGIIDVKDDVFIGSNTAILANVFIGSNVVIGAGSLVNRVVPAGKVVVGFPARVIGNTADLAIKRKRYSDSQVAKMKSVERLKYLWGAKE